MNRAKDVFDQNSLVNQSLLIATFDSREGKNLLLSGTYGTGKSHLSFSEAKKLIEKGHTALFLSVPKLVTKIKET